MDAALHKSATFILTAALGMNAPPGATRTRLAELMI